MTQQTLYRARVTRQVEDQFWVEIPSLGIGFEQGPVEYPWDTDIRVGDRVLVGMVEGALNDVVCVQVMGRDFKTYDGGDLDGYDVISRVLDGGQADDPTITGVADGGEL